MACIYCERRKGKRTCPALGGMICTQCCGEHRLREITCPRDCVHLGGLAVVRDESASFTKADYGSMWEKLHVYAQSAVAFRNEALGWCFDDAPDEWETGIATGYLYYGHRDATRQRLVDRFLAERGRGLASGEAAAVVSLQRAWASLFEVVAVQTGTGLELRDAFPGETIRVREVSASGQLQKWDVLFTWVMTFPDHLELTGAACIVPRPQLDRVRRAIEQELETVREERPGVIDRELVGSVAWCVLEELREISQDRRLPELRTTDGEALQLCKAHFSVTDEAAVRAKLATVLDADGTDYIWVDREGNKVMAGPVTLGHVRLGHDGLVLETMSRERNIRGKQLLADALGELIVHRADSIQAPEAALRDARPVENREQVPDDVQREVLGTYLRDHYVKWLDDEIPALGGKTPRNAVRTRQGRAQVERMLADIEHQVQRMPGGDTVDIAGMRRELGFDKRAHSGRVRSYDADAAPDAEPWLAADDQEKASLVEHHHAGLSQHGDIPNPQLHALVHVIVENQLAAKHPPAMATLDRLVRAGVTRHHAIHAIGSVVAEAIFDVMKHSKAVDPDATARALASLRSSDWR